MHITDAEPTTLTTFTRAGVVALQNRLATARDQLGTTHLARVERGAAMAEYGLLLALVALVAIGAVSAFGQQLSDVFTEAEGHLRTDGTTAPTQ